MEHHEFGQHDKFLVAIGDFLKRPPSLLWVFHSLNLTNDRFIPKKVVLYLFFAQFQAIFSHFLLESERQRSPRYLLFARLHLIPLFRLNLDILITLVFLRELLIEFPEQLGSIGGQTNFKHD